MPRAPILTLLLLASACAARCARARLDEGQANEVLVALDEAGIARREAARRRQRGRLARRGRRAPTLAPRPPGPRRARAAAAAPARLRGGVRKGSMVPTPTEEHALFLHALSGELARSVEAIDGVVEARVHLGLPLAGSAPRRPAPPGRAAVLVKCRRGARAAVGRSSPASRRSWRARRRARGHRRLGGGDRGGPSGAARGPAPRPPRAARRGRARRPPGARAGRELRWRSGSASAARAGGGGRVTPRPEAARDPGRGARARPGRAAARARRLAPRPLPPPSSRPSSPRGSRAERVRAVGPGARPLAGHPAGAAARAPGAAPALARAALVRGGAGGGRAPALRPRTASAIPASRAGFAAGTGRGLEERHGFTVVAPPGHRRLREPHAGSARSGPRGRRRAGGRSVAALLGVPVRSRARPRPSPAAAAAGSRPRRLPLGRPRRRRRCSRWSRAWSRGPWSDSAGGTARTPAALVPTPVEQSALELAALAALDAAARDGSGVARAAARALGRGARTPGEPSPLAVDLDLAVGPVRGRAPPARARRRAPRARRPAGGAGRRSPSSSSALAPRRRGLAPAGRSSPRSGRATSCSSTEGAARQELVLPGGLAVRGPRRGRRLSRGGVEHDRDAGFLPAHPRGRARPGSRVTFGELARLEPGPCSRSTFAATGASCSVPASAPSRAGSSSTWRARWASASSSSETAVRRPSRPLRGGRCAAGGSPPEPCSVLLARRHLGATSAAARAAALAVAGLAAAAFACTSAATGRGRPTRRARVERARRSAAMRGRARRCRWTPPARRLRHRWRDARSPSSPRRREVPP